VDGVGQQVTLVVHARQTDFRQCASGDAMILRAESVEAASRLAPVVEHMQVLFVPDVLLDVPLSNYVDYENSLNISGLSFSLAVKDVPKFEKQNPLISVSV